MIIVLISKVKDLFLVQKVLDEQETILNNNINMHCEGASVISYLYLPKKKNHSLVLGIR